MERLEPQLQAESVFDFSRFMDERGHIRLGIVRSELLSSKDEPDLGQLRALWKYWRDDSEYLVLQKQTTLADYRVDLETHWAKCSKRGNDVYVRRTKRKLAGLQLRGETDIVFHDWKKAKSKSYILFVTLTTAIQKTNIAESWSENVAKDWNRWITALRKKFGCGLPKGKRNHPGSCVESFRAFESTEKGYPHIHCMLVFRDCEFDVHREMKTVDGRLQAKWRVSYDVKEQIRGNFPAFIDVQSPRTYSSIIRYMSKHILKGTDKTGAVGEFEERGDELSPREDSFQRAAKLGDTTLSLMWVFRKRSFSVSRGLQDKLMAHARVLADLIPALRNSNRLDDSLSVKWVCLGVFAKWELRIDSDRWYGELDWVSLNLEPRVRHGFRVNPLTDGAV